MKQTIALLSSKMNRYSLIFLIITVSIYSSTLAAIPPYDRNDWPDWADDDRDCMNTRHELLRAQSKVKPRMSRDSCYVIKGEWIDPYSNKRYGDAINLHVDHVVPIAWAYYRGASGWSGAKKKRFYSDPTNLLIVSAALNMEKRASGPNKWMPPNQKFRCQYIQIWQTVLTRYPELQMRSGEYRIFNKQKKACGISAGN